MFVIITKWVMENRGRGSCQGSAPKSVIAQLNSNISMMFKKPIIDNELEKTLDAFLDHLNEVEHNLLNGVFNVKFAEAGLFLQNSTDLYSKKVDMLCEKAAQLNSELCSLTTKAPESKNGPEETLNKVNKIKGSKKRNLLLTDTTNENLKEHLVNDVNNFKNFMDSSICTEYQDQLLDVWKKTFYKLNSLNNPHNEVVNSLVTLYHLCSKTNKALNNVLFELNEDIIDVEFDELLCNYKDIYLNHFIPNAESNSYIVLEDLEVKLKLQDEDWLLQVYLNRREISYKTFWEEKLEDNFQLFCKYYRCGNKILSLKNLVVKITRLSNNLLAEYLTPNESNNALAQSIKKGSERISNSDSAFLEGSLISAHDEIDDDRHLTDSADSGIGYSEEFTNNRDDSLKGGVNICSFNSDNGLQNITQDAYNNDNTINTEYMKSPDNVIIDQMKNLSEEGVKNIHNDSEVRILNTQVDKVIGDESRENITENETINKDTVNNVEDDTSSCLCNSVENTKITKENSNHTTESVIKSCLSTSKILRPVLLRNLNSKKRKYEDSQENNPVKPKKPRRIYHHFTMYILKTVTLDIFEKFYHEHYLLQLNESYKLFSEEVCTQVSGESYSMSNRDNFTYFSAEPSTSVTESNSQITFNLIDSVEETVSVNNVSDDAEQQEEYTTTIIAEEIVRDEGVSHNSESVDENISVQNTNSHNEFITQPLQEILNIEQENACNEVFHANDSESIIDDEISEDVAYPRSMSKSLQMLANVTEWQQFMESRLKNSEHDSEFNIHEYGTYMINSLSEGEEKKFSDIVCGKNSAEVTRMFAASLQLANSYNIEMITSEEGKLANDDLKIKLLNKERHYERLNNYEAPSENLFRQKLVQVQAQQSSPSQKKHKRS